MIKRAVRIACALMLMFSVVHAGTPTPGDVAPTPSDEEARTTVRDALAELGLNDEQIDERLEQMTDEDVRYFADHTEHIQTAGAVPRYIWILLGVFLGVLILSAIL